MLYLSSHAILEYDQHRLWSEMGFDVFSIGAYTDPTNPVVDLRPAIAAPAHPVLAAACVEQRERHAKHSTGYPIIDWAKADLAQEVIDWADVIIVDCYPESWISHNWDRIRDKRVIWRTIGQSGPETEAAMKMLEGLQIVRYSPAERRAYGSASWFAGEDVMIRFGKDPADWYGWTGEEQVIGNLAQHDPVPHARGQFLHWWWLVAATKDLPLSFGGPNSEKIGGLGALPYEEMRAYLRRIRAYIYTGTVPASYTLGLIEAMMTGVPIVSIGRAMFGMDELFEVPDILPPAYWYDVPANAREVLEGMLGQPDEFASGIVRERAVELFGIDTIRTQWADFLGVPARKGLVTA